MIRNYEYSLLWPVEHIDLLYFVRKEQLFTADQLHVVQILGEPNKVLYRERLKCDFRFGIYHLQKFKLLTILNAASKAMIGSKAPLA